MQGNIRQVVLQGIPVVGLVANLQQICRHWLLVAIDWSTALSLTPKTTELMLDKVNSLQFPSAQNLVLEG